MALLLALGSALAQGWASATIDWQPALWRREPWRALSAAFVHYSMLHLAGNAAGLALVAALGAAARAPGRVALAWLMAWPLTQVGLLWQPELAHYGGLSGVVHAGVAIVCVYLIVAGRRFVGGGILAGLLAKVLSESPWGAPLRHPPGWDIAIAPAAHACGLVAGLACAAFVEAVAWLRRRPENAGA